MSPAHHLDPRGSHKPEKRTTITKCATCPQPVTANDWKNGSRRCLACRKAEPGRRIQVTMKTSFNSMRQPDQQMKPKAPSGDSWWIGMERTRFMATAYGKHPTVSPPSSINIALSPGGKIGY